MSYGRGGCKETENCFESFKFCFLMLFHVFDQFDWVFNCKDESLIRVWKKFLVFFEKLLFLRFIFLNFKGFGS